MKKFNLPLIADTLLAALCVFLLFFTLVRYYFSSAAGLAAGIIAGLAAGGAAYAYISLKQRKKLTRSADKSAAEKLAVELCVLPQDKAINLFAQCFDECKIFNDCVETEKDIYFICFKLEPADRDDILAAAKADTQKQKILACITASAGLKSLAEQLSIKLYCIEDIYSELKKREKLPQNYVLGNKVRSAFWARIKARFTRKICLPCFLSGLTLMFFSYFTFFPVYYIVAGSLLLTLCAAAAVFGQPKSA